MAWSLDPASGGFLDTFLRYTPSTQTTLFGKWTSSAAGVANGVVGDDGLQTRGAGHAKKIATNTTAGRIIGMRASKGFTNGTSSIVTFLDSTDAVRLKLEYLELAGQVRLTKPSGATVTSATLSWPTGTEHNIAAGIFYDGVNVNFTVYFDGVVVADLTGTEVNATLPILSRFETGTTGATLSMGKYLWFWSKAYTGTGGIWAASDFFGNVKRGAEVPAADGQYPATQVGARILPNAGTDYFSRMNETVADTTTYSSDIVDANNAPAAVDRASVALTDPAVTLVNVHAVQRCTLMQMLSGTGTVRLFTGVTGSAGDTFDSPNITPASSYTYALKYYALDPRDGLAWSRAKLVNLDLGVEVRDLV